MKWPLICLFHGVIGYISSSATILTLIRVFDTFDIDLVPLFHHHNLVYRLVNPSVQYLPKERSNEPIRLSNTRVAFHLKVGKVLAKCQRCHRFSIFTLFTLLLIKTRLAFNPGLYQVIQVSRP